MNQQTVKDKKPLQITSELQRRIFGADSITQIDLTAGFHPVRMALGDEKYTAFRTKFGLYEYMVMPFGLTNGPATFQREINRTLRPHLGIELVINKKIDIDEDGGLLVVACIDDVLIAPKGSIEKHRKQVGRLFDLLFKNNMRIEIDKCHCDQTDVAFLEFIVNGKSIQMDPKKAHTIVDWLRPSNQKDVQQLLGLWNLYGRFIL